MKVAFVVHRYGAEIIGGAESLARQLADKLATMTDTQVDVFTTCARNYQTWENELPSGETLDGAVTVRRYAVDFPRCETFFNRISDSLFAHDSPPPSTELELKWAKEQGPYSSLLMKSITEKKDDYDAFIFVTYLYATTLFALPLVKEKSILIPTAHDEVTIYLKLFDKLFAQAREILFLTEKEREFVESRFSRLKQGQIGSEKSSMILSVGVDGPDPQLLEQQLSEILHNESSIQSPSLPTTQGISQAIKDLLKEKTAYLLYLGRIDKNKGCDHLYGCFAYFCWKYKTTRLKLIFAGTQHFFPDPHPNIQILGKVTEEEKWLLLKNAVTTVLPSQFESLSLSVLESFTVGTPVLVNRKCEVLQATIEKSGGGYSFLEAEDFCDRLLELTRDPIESKKGLGEKGRTYVTTHYSWPSAVKTLTKTIERVSH